jgi:hypothetical protein
MAEHIPCVVVAIPFALLTWYCLVAANHSGAGRAAEKTRNEILSWKSPLWVRVPLAKLAYMVLGTSRFACWICAALTLINGVLATCAQERFLWLPCIIYGGIRQWLPNLPDWDCRG